MLSDRRRSVAFGENSRAEGAPSKPSDFEDPNDFFLDMYAKAIDRIQGAGADPEEAALMALDVLHSTIESIAADHAASLEEHGQTYVQDSIVYRVDFAERLRVYWGPSLDLHEKITSAVEEGGRIFARRNAGRSGEPDQLLGVLIHLNGQAVRASREVHALLSAGFPFGGHALSRTVHEIAVRAGVLAKFGKEEPHLDLAEQFVRAATRVTSCVALAKSRSCSAERTPGVRVRSSRRMAVVISPCCQGTRLSSGKGSWSTRLAMATCVAWRTSLRSMKFRPIGFTSRLRQRRLRSSP